MGPCLVLVEGVLWYRKLKLVKVQKFEKPCAAKAQERAGSSCTNKSASVLTEKEQRLRKKNL